MKYVKCKTCGNETFNCLTKYRQVVKVEIEHNGEDILGYSDEIISDLVLDENSEDEHFCAKCGKKDEAV